MRPNSPKRPLLASCMLVTPAEVAGGRLDCQRGRVLNGELVFQGGPNQMAQIQNGSMERRIAEILIQELKLENVTPDTFDANCDLVKELGIDSMDLTTVVLVLQGEYKVKFDEDSYPTLTTVRAIAEQIRQLQGTVS
jgi:acyl carrier protein